MKLLAKLLLFVLIILSIVYFSGPKAEFDRVDNTALSIDYPIFKLDDMIRLREKQIEGIKKDNQSQFVWIDSLNKTEYSMVYLHGFSASHGEAQPILDNYAKRYGCNSYFPRLRHHGLENENAMINLSPKDMVDSAKEAIAIAKSIGKKTIVISTSTGSALACYLAANDPDIHALICTSPNFDLFDSNSQLLVQPWGKEVFRYMMGGNYRQWTAGAEVNKYWTTKNRIEAHIAIRDLLNQTMIPKTFQNIKQAIYLGYYYRNEDKMDKVISIKAIEKFSKHLASPDSLIQIKVFENAQRHVISSPIMNDNWEDVQESIFEFTEKKIGLKPVER